MSRLQFTRTRYRIRAAEDTVEEWKALHKEAMKLRDYETVLAECSQMAILLQEMISGFTKEFLAGDPDALALNDRLNMAEIGEHWARIFTSVVEEGASFHRYFVENHGKAQECLGKLQKATARLRQTCPEADLAAIDAAREDVKQGKTLSFEDAFPDALPLAPA